MTAFQRGVDPLPNYSEPAQSPYSAPHLAAEYPLVLTTGARVPVFYHSQHRNNPWQRELYPHPQVEIDPATAERFGVVDGTWTWIETTTGKIRMLAKVTLGMLPGVVSMAHGWWQGCEELGLPGYGWDGANANVLISGDDHDPALGVPGTRSQLCKVYPAEEPPFVWEPPYYGTTKPADGPQPAAADDTGRRAGLRRRAQVRRSRGGLMSRRALLVDLDLVHRLSDLRRGLQG